MDRRELVRRLVIEAAHADLRGDHRFASSASRLLVQINSHIGVRLSKKDDGLNKHIVKEKDHGGYVVRTEFVYAVSPDEGVEMDSAYTHNGDYIGDPKTAKMLVKEKGILPELSSPDHNVCSIGYCPDKEQWFGWSHRAIKGFGVGDTPEQWFPSGSSKGKKIKNLDEAKQAAIAFAESVS